MDMVKTSNIDSKQLELDSLIDDELKEKLSDRLDLSDIGSIDLSEAEAIANEEVMVFRENDFFANWDGMPRDDSLVIPTYDEFTSLVAQEREEEACISSKDDTVEASPCDEYMLDMGENVPEEILFLNKKFTPKEDGKEGESSPKKKGGLGIHFMDIRDVESIPGKFGVPFGLKKKSNEAESDVNDDSQVETDSDVESDGKTDPESESQKKSSSRGKRASDDGFREFEILKEGELSYFEHSMFGDRKARVVPEKPKPTETSEKVPSIETVQENKKGTSHEVEKSKEFASEELSSRENFNPQEVLMDITDRVVILEDEAEIENFANRFPEKKEDLIKLFTYFDGLFEKLPEDIIMKFADSEYFDLYMKVINEME